AATAGADAAALAHLRAVLLLDRDALPPGRIAAAHELLLDWQQFTGPVMAKGVEDTALYNDHALLAANEVGGDPAKPAVSAERLHAFLAARTATPHTLNTTATHDTKRGEDARARLAVLTREPEAWAALVETWLDTHPGGRARI